MTLDIIEAIHDDQLFRPFLGDDLSSWSKWLSALRFLYGLKLTKADRETIGECTGIAPQDVQAVEGGFDQALFLCGRRSGKSRIAAIIGAFEAVLSGREKNLAPGEQGLLLILSPTKRQSQIVHGYLRAIFQTPILAQEVIAETKEGFNLRNGVRVETMASDFRSVRGWTLLGAILDEACYMGVDDDSKVRNDQELIRAISPSLATSGGPLIAISSPFQRRGWAYKTWDQNYGKVNPNVLVWQAPSRVMNPSLPKKVVDQALASDQAAARAEFLSEWRSDCESYLPRNMVEACVVKGRTDNIPLSNRTYEAFADLASGGGGDSAALAVAHKDAETGRVILDKIRAWKSPFDPLTVVRLMADELRQWGLRSVMGDRFASGFVTRTFERNGIDYEPSTKKQVGLISGTLADAGFQNDRIT